MPPVVCALLSFLAACFKAAQNIIVLPSRLPRSGMAFSPQQTLLGKSRWSFSNAIGVHFTRGVDAISLVFKWRLQDRFRARFRKPRHNFRYIYG
jgi:hypothetical protein